MCFCFVAKISILTVSGHNDRLGNKCLVSLAAIIIHVLVCLHRFVFCKKLVCFFSMTKDKRYTCAGYDQPEQEDDDDVTRHGHHSTGYQPVNAAAEQLQPGTVVYTQPVGGQPPGITMIQREALPSNGKAVFCSILVLIFCGMICGIVALTYARKWSITSNMTRRLFDETPFELRRH